MKSNLQPDRINLATFNRLLAQYDDCVPKQLADLEELRLHTIPEALAERAAVAAKGEEEEEEEEEGAYLEKDELKSLVEWKLKHGTFRPNLLKLATSNSAEDIISTSRKAFSECPCKTATIAIPDASAASDVSRSIATLTRLRGIGPSTASLVLSCYSPDTIPFFSDELFRYMHWDESAVVAGGKSHGDGWSRRIKYTPAEYKSLLQKVWQWRSRVERESGELVRVIDLEKVAYVLGKGAGEGYDNDDHNDNDDEQEEKEKENGANNIVQPEEGQPPTEADTKKRKAQSKTINSRKRREK